jgi:hypothetical protein
LFASIDYDVVEFGVYDGEENGKDKGEELGGLITGSG